MFDITLYGFPYAVFGIIYQLLFSFLLPPVSLPGARCGKREDEVEFDELLVGLRVSQNSPIVGKSIEEAGLRSLDKLYLVSVERGGYPIPLASPSPSSRFSRLFRMFYFYFLFFFYSLLPDLQ
jgi:hypothetical protein